jgi:NADH dehydrogenase [ubiquinone] 1 alpha subcomplex assembly factor 5
VSDAIRVFDRAAVRRHRARAAARFGEHDFLKREVADRLADRLVDMTRKFPVALDLGCHDGTLGRELQGRGGIATLVQCDVEPAMAARAAGLRVVADEELLPFAPARFDAVLSVLSLHWVNDLPGTLIQVAQSLKPDGLFLAAVFGAGTLAELRAAWSEAELAVEGGVSPRVSPFAELRDAAGLLQRAGFALPVADAETITVTYADPFRLMAELRGMGEANAVAERRKRFTRRATAMAAAQAYREGFAGADGRITASFEVIWLTAWKPHASQQQPLRPGSAAARLADALGTTERPAGERVGRR